MLQELMFDHENTLIQHKNNIAAFSTDMNLFSSASCSEVSKEINDTSNFSNQSMLSQIEAVKKTKGAAFQMTEVIA